MITEKRLHELLDYEADTGVFTRRIARRNAKAGSVAGSVNGSGYRHIMLDGRKYKAHRLVPLWLLGVRVPPGLQIDHINGIRDDNRAVNLRLATNQQNQFNCRRQGNNTSGVKGVAWHKQHNKWQSNVRVHDRLIHIGYFTDLDEAAAATHQARVALQGEYANHG